MSIEEVTLQAERWADMDKASGGDGLTEATAWGRDSVPDIDEPMRIHVIGTLWGDTTANGNAAVFPVVEGCTALDLMGEHDTRPWTLREDAQVTWEKVAGRTNIYRANIVDYYAAQVAKARTKSKKKRKQARKDRKKGRRR